MLIHRWDAAAAPDEWRSWLATTAPFGQLVVNNLERDEAPIVVPTHAALEGDLLLVHLARPNPAWPHIEAARRVKFVLSDNATHTCPAHGVRTPTPRARPASPPATTPPSSSPASRA